MFYLYDIEGLQFRGSLETLEQARTVNQIQPNKPLKFDEQLSRQPYSPSSQAIKTYQNVVRHEQMVEPLVHIYQIMSSPVSTITKDISLHEAWRMLTEGNVRQLVVTTEANNVIGIISDRDILRHINVSGNDTTTHHNLAVQEVIDREVLTTDAMSDIRRVARVMAFYHTDAIPVTDHDRLIGIVTRGDILRGFAENPKLNLWG